MSFGGPPKVTTRPTPPDRGSFPLDHEGECKHVMTRYLECLQVSKGNNKRCKPISKEYLECRMQRKLMVRDEWQNLGFHEDSSAQAVSTEPRASPSRGKDKG
ncbi:Suppressor of Sensor Kinase (SLN1) [Coemansia sp. RSA 2050]|nr:Suppressor of Sensor Kinase (SLN1) [Coemansia sp. RSA 2050]KAJ2735108.1 Suppressor of Sensor Kinase (SLN1) [Coemansia sp. BCRC 34962]